MEQIISQPWLLPVVVIIVVCILGLLISRRSGGLSGIIFFLPNMLIDLLSILHTKKFKYYGIVLALLSIEAFFAFRAATVYYDVLSSRMPALEMDVVCVIVFMAVFLCGYMVATHGGKWTKGRVCTMIVVILHDWAGTAWMNYSQPATASTNATVTAPDDPLKVVLTIGMCVLGLLPFIMGAWADELRPLLEAELDEEVDTFTSKATRQIKRRAVNRVLRLANRTDVVRLVRALPADEFLSFKHFVMPIIAEPGTPYNLPVEQVQESQESVAPKPKPVEPELEALKKEATNGHTPATDFYQRYLELVAVTPAAIATIPWLANKLGVSKSTISNYRRKSKSNEHDELTIFQPAPALEEANA